MTDYDGDNNDDDDDDDDDVRLGTPCFRLMVFCGANSSWQ
jgi:hypothetical protein